MRGLRRAAHLTARGAQAHKLPALIEALQSEDSREGVQAFRDKRPFEIYSSNFLMEHMWALLLVLFSFAYLVDAGMGALERRVDYYSAARG